MHLAEIYSLSAGQTISKSEILVDYFPISSLRYITIQPFSKPLKNYNLWIDVINMLRQYAPDIDIIQIGGPEEVSLPHCINLQGKTSIRQAAYILKHSLLHFGVDSFGAHLAGTFNVPCVIMYANNFVNNVKPYFLDTDKFVSFTPKNISKPIFSLDIGYQPLDSIYPHEIVTAIFKLLGREFKGIEYTFIGDGYHKKMLELIPVSTFTSSTINFDNISVRMDVEFNENVLLEQSRRSKVIVYTDRKINLDLLKHIRPQIVDVIFELKDPNDLDIKWFKNIQNAGINFNTFTRLSQDQVKPLKIAFCELGNIFVKEPAKKPNTEATKYLSGKLVVANNKYYSSIYDYKLGKLSKPTQFINMMPIGEDNFFEELDHFALIK